VITPFNFPSPFRMEDRTALIYGNTVVWKPAACSAAGMRLASALTRRLPAACSLSSRLHLGDGIVNHIEVDAVTFTGSTGIGRRIAAQRPARRARAMRDGRENAAVVLDDAEWNWLSSR